MDMRLEDYMWWQNPLGFISRQLVAQEFIFDMALFDRTPPAQVSPVILRLYTCVFAFVFAYVFVHVFVFVFVFAFAEWARQAGAGRGEPGRGGAGQTDRQSDRQTGQTD